MSPDARTGRIVTVTSRNRGRNMNLPIGHPVRIVRTDIWASGNSTHIIETMGGEHFATVCDSYLTQP
jgi:hypothetical protein